MKSKICGLRNADKVQRLKWFLCISDTSRRDLKKYNVGIRVDQIYDEKTKYDLHEEDGSRGMERKMLGQEEIDISQKAKTH